MSTTAVIFLASPHRGTEHCNLGDAVQSMAIATSSIDPNDPVLHELCGTNGVELELGRQTFVRLWNDYNFKVKTFQESVIPSYLYPELRTETVHTYITPIRMLCYTNMNRQYGVCRASLATRGKTQRPFTRCMIISASLGRQRIRDTARWPRLSLRLSLVRKMGYVHPREQFEQG